MRVYKDYEVDDQSFYKIPKSLFGNPNYKGLLPETKLAYAFLRDRMDLSKKNGWVNEQGEIYLIYTREHIAEMLEMSAPHIIKCFKQLNEYKLIKEIRQGLGKPNLIFICHVELNKETSQKLKPLMSGSKQSLHQDVNAFNANDTDVSDTDFNETENSKGISQKCSPQTFTDEGKNLFNYFIKKYEEVIGEEHPRINNETIEKINDLAKKETLFDADNEFELYIDIEAMIDEYFNSNYHLPNGRLADHRIWHFLSEQILINLANRTK